MKRLVLLVGLGGLLCTATTRASLVTLYQGSFSHGQGGEFAAASADLYNAYGNNYAAVAKNQIAVGTYGNSLQTFCIETGEEFTPGVTYSYKISPNALWGGAAGYPGKPVAWGTAWLYYEFATGGLAAYGYDYGANRSTTAGDLQLAIWYAQGLTTSLDGNVVGYSEAGRNGTAFYNDAVAAGLLAGITNVKNASSGAFDVMALNLGDPGQVQDQLVLVPEPGTCVAGALLLLPFGASTLRAFRKSRTV